MMTFSFDFLRNEKSNLIRLEYQYKNLNVTAASFAIVAAVITAGRLLYEPVRIDQPLAGKKRLFLS